MEHIYILAGVFFIISTLFSMIGMGGGSLYVPILLFAGFTFQQAPGISLILIVATSLAALTTFTKGNKVDWKLALVIDPPTDLMAFVGGYYSASLSENTLKSLLVFILMIAGTLMLLKKKKGTANVNDNHKEACGYQENDNRARRWYLWHRTFNDVQYSVHLPIVLTATAFIGILSGMLGITGGIIKLPIMVLICGVPMDIAVATSTVMVAVTALFGLVGHAIGSGVEWHTGGILAITAVCGGLIGSRISLATDKALLKKYFGVVVWLIALKILYQLIF